MMQSVTLPSEPDAEVPLTKAGRTREAIAKAARELFVTHDYADASLRTIAARAGVDPAMVIRYFKSKENLFLETVGFEGFFAQAMSGPLDGLGQRLVSALLSDQRDGFASYRALIRASGSEQIRKRLRDAIDTMFVEPLTPRISGPDAELRARLVSAQISGLVTAIAIVGDEVLAATDSERLAEVYGATIQGLIGTDS